MHRLLLGMAAMLPLCAAAVAEEGTLTEAEWLDELPVVLAGSRLDQTIADAPVAISVIDREMIEASGAREIQELFRLVPGMIVAHDNGHHAVVSYHALADPYSRRMLVLIDGRAAYSPVISHTNWTMLPLALEDIERIEVIRGPNAAAFGANALLGVISITTRRPHLARGFTTRTTLGNNGIYRQSATLGGGRDTFSWRLTTQALGDHGYDTSGRDVATVDQDDKDTVLLSGRADWQSENGSRWELHAGMAEGRREHGGVNNRLRPEHDITSNNGYAQLNWRSGDDATDRHAVRGYWTLDSWDQTYLTQPMVELGGLQGLWELSVRGERYELEYQRTLALRGNWRSAWGLASRLDRMQAPGYLGRPDTLSTTLHRAFTHHELRFSPDWVANVGLMLEHDRATGTELSPRIALNWSYSPGQVLRASYSRATRTPAIVEDNANHELRFSDSVVDQLLLSTGNLRAERMRSRELGWVYSSAVRDLTIDARIFNDKIDRLITYYFEPYPDLDGIVQDFRNFDQMALKGFEVQARWRPTPSLRLIGNYAYTDIDSTDTDELYSESGPRNIGSMFAEYRFGSRTFSSATWYRFGEMHGLNTGTYVKRHERVDLKVAHEFALGGTAARLSLTVQQPIGDLSDFRTRNDFRRRVFADLRIRF